MKDMQHTALVRAATDGHNKF